MMDRFDSQACLIDSDVLNNEHGEEAEFSFSSGYESSDSDDSGVNDTPPSGLSCPGEMMFFSSTSALCNSLEFIITMPEMCNVTFLVGKSRVPVYGVKAILATRSRILYQLILQHQREADRQRLLRSRSRRHRTEDHLIIPMEDYREEEFYRLIKFLHCGKIRIDLKVVVGLLCAAAEYELTDLQNACWELINRCQSNEEKQVLLKSAAKYHNKKSAQKVMSQVRLYTRKETDV